MPRHPRIEAKVEGIRPSVFARLIELMKAHGAPRFPFHIGDTYLPPPEPCRLDALAADPPPKPYSYSHPFGDDRLREAFAAKLRRDNGLDWATADHVSLTCGATHALFAGCQVLLSPGDEVIIPSPYWPLITGIVRGAGAMPVEVRYWTELGHGDELDPVGPIRERITPKTVALYINTPNNPTGRALPRAALQALVDLAVEHDLWIISDEAYEQYAFGGFPHVTLASLPGAAERTLSVFSFSKSYAMAGYRAGFLAGPADLVVSIRKMTNHSTYSVPGIVQAACLRALEGGADWLVSARSAYADAAALTAERLQGRFHPAEGAAYVWLDIEGDGWELLERALAVGVSLAPGAGFGEGFDRSMRLCYVACDLRTLAEGIDALNRVL
jgi:aspartate/methionine/tyrosine aminotransferase